MTCVLEGDILNFGCSITSPLKSVGHKAYNLKIKGVCKLKKIAIATILLSALMGAMIGTVSAQPKYCGTSAYDVKYRAIYDYPTGSYWKKQIATYPAYYAEHNVEFMTKYHCY